MTDEHIKRLDNSELTDLFLLLSRAIKSEQINLYELKDRFIFEPLAVQLIESSSHSGDDTFIRINFQTEID